MVVEIMLSVEIILLKFQFYDVLYECLRYHVVLDWVRQTQSWTHVDGYTAVGNSASDRVLKRLGFSDMGIVHPEVFDGEASRLWRLSL